MPKPEFKLEPLPGKKEGDKKPISASEVSEHRSSNEEEELDDILRQEEKGERPLADNHDYLPIKENIRRLKELREKLEKKEKEPPLFKEK